MAVTDKSNTETLRAQWTELYTKTLPAHARERNPSQTRWPVTLDHCFARIILDNTVGRGVLQWDNVIQKPAVRNMNEEQLQAAIELGEKIKEGQADLVELDKQSLKARGKNEKKYQDKDQSATKVVKRERTDEEQDPPLKRQKQEQKPTTSTKTRQATISFAKKNTETNTNTNNTTTETSNSPSSPLNKDTNHPNPNLTLLLQKISIHPALTPFRKRLYSTLLSVPAGEYTTYASMAKYLSSSARAVGNGMRNNPFAPDVPCHRVIAADGTLGGFGGDWGVEGRHANKKVDLLRGEGVTFDSRGKVKGGVFGGLRDMSEVVGIGVE